jgi:hypothetical protein
MRRWADIIFADPQEMNNGWYQPYAVLNFGRMLYTLASGRVVSKLAGAEWAKRTLDSRWTGLIDRAWEKHAGQWLRASQKADPDDFKGTLAYIRYVLAESDNYAVASD